jgi:hypothetical protein
MSVCGGREQKCEKGHTDGSEKDGVARVRERERKETERIRDVPSRETSERVICHRNYVLASE